MSEVWFVSDSHYGHKKILEYEPIARPFATVDEMNETMILLWNSVVGKYDKVYHLGDFCFGRDNIAIAGRLNGQKRLVMGNHDAYPASEYLKYFLSIHGALFWQKCLLTHVPVHPSSLDNRAKLNLHGHYHSKKIDNELYVNCSVEQNKLTPIHADIILAKINDR